MTYVMNCIYFLSALISQRPEKYIKQNHYTRTNCLKFREIMYTTNESPLTKLCQFIGILLRHFSNDRRPPPLLLSYKSISTLLVLKERNINQAERCLRAIFRQFVLLAPGSWCRRSERVWEHLRMSRLFHRCYLEQNLVAGSAEVHLQT